MAGAAPKGSLGLTPGWEVTCWTGPRVPILDILLAGEEEEVEDDILAKLDQLLVVDDWLDDCTGLVPVVGHGLVFSWVKFEAPKELIGSVYFLAMLICYCTSTLQKSYSDPGQNRFQNLSYCTFILYRLWKSKVALPTV